MITPTTLRIAIRTKLNEAFPTIPVISQDVEKGFVQPSFTVRFEEYRAEQIQESLEQSLIVRVFYFPNFDDEEMSIDVLGKMYEIPFAFGNKLIVEDRALNVIEPEVIDIDGILEFSFNLLFEQYIESLDSEYGKELMQELHIQIKKEGC